MEKRFLNTFITGRERQITLPNGKIHRGQFVLTDLDDILASHNEINFSSTEGYPLNTYGQNINDRNYKDDPALQNAVVSIAQKLNPDQLIAINSDANGTPIIDKNGYVVSGNNRVMSLKLASKKYPEKYENYKNKLREDIEIFNIDEKSFNLLKKPVLVRLDKDLPDNLTTKDLSQFNPETTKGERPVDKAIKLSNILLENTICRNIILNIIDGYDTFSDIYSTKDVQAKNDRKKLVENLIECELIPELQLPTYFNDAQFTETGKDFVETILSAIILTPDALKVSDIEGVKRMRQVIISCLPILIANDNLKEGSLRKYISEAILIQYKVNNFLDFQDFVVNQSLFQEEKFNKKSFYIYLALNEGRNQFKRDLRTYNQSVKANEGVSLFETEKLSIDDIFNKIFVETADPKDVRLINMLFSKDETPKLNSMLDINIDTNDIEIEERIVDDINDYKELTLEERINLICNDNWYKLHPEKILGTPYQSSGRYGEVTKYKGTIDALDLIDAPFDFFGFSKSMDNPTISINNIKNESAEALKEANKENIERAIEVANKEIFELKKAKVKKVKTLTVAQFKNVEEIKTFREMYYELNPNITDAMLEAYIWYKTQIGQPLSANYVAILHPERFSESDDLRQPYSYNLSKDSIDALVKTSNLFYTENGLLPLYEYSSGNLFDKKIDLDKNKDYIIENYSLEVFEKQSEILKGSFKKLIKLQLVGDNALSILPTSKFAKEFKIKRIKSNIEDDTWKVAINKEGLFDEKNFEKDKKQVNVDEISLFNAFAWYLMNKKPLLKRNISHYAIVHYYLFKANFGKNLSDKEKSAIKDYTRQEGDRLFMEFLQNELLVDDILRLETIWNIDFNNYVPIDFDLIPLSFSIAKYVNGFQEKIKSEKRDAIAHAMSNGTSILAYDVGVGKTPSAIFTISTFIESGYCKKPLIVVPNQVYRQFIGEIKMFTPQYKINEFYNLSQEYIDAIRNGVITVDDYSITIITYEGFEKIGFSDETRALQENVLFEILNQGQEGKAGVEFRQRLQELVGKGNRSSVLTIEEIGIDFACFDEAHKMKKVFTSVKGEVKTNSEGDEKREKNPYQLSSGKPSAIALKGFMIIHYLLEKNKYKNILLLTATPFTNSPLEIYSMLAMVAYKKLSNTQLNGLQSFFDTFVQISNELVVNSRLQIQKKEVVLGFNNLIALQSLIRRFVLHKTGDQTVPPVPRPKKYLLPYLQESVNGTIINLSKEKQIDTYISMTDAQESFMDDIINYVEGNLSEETMEKNAKNINNTELGIEMDEDEIVSSDSFIVDVNGLDEDEKIGVRTLKGISMSRNLALSPYLYKYSGLTNPTYTEYIESSPKLVYVMECIKSVRNYHLSKNEPISGQVIYMDRGIQYYPLIKQYLINVIGYNENEVGIIQSGLPKNGKKSKDYVKNLFNGEIYNEETKEFEKVSDAERLKIVIGSSTIKEGMNLQKYSTVLYNCSVDWNPTDMQQLEGRIYRQGNAFNGVRIVIPLLINSADIFLFQKLQEKSSRLHSIWSTNNLTNKMQVGELNTAEVKYALLRNPEKIAELKIKEEVEKLEEELLLIERKFKNGDDVRIAINTIKNNYEKAKEQIKPYRKFVETEDFFKNAIKLASLIADAKRKNNIDVEGKSIYYDYEWKFLGYKKQNEIERSQLTNKYWPSSEANKIREAVKNYKAYKESIIKNDFPNLDIDNYNDLIDEYQLKYENQKNVVNDKLDYIKTPEYFAIIVGEIIEQKAKNQLAYKSISELVAGFSSFNYLLSDKKVKEGKKIDITPVEVVETEIMQPIIQNIGTEIDVPSINTEKLIKALEISLKFAYSNSKLIIEKQIKALKISLKYGN